VIVAQKKKNKDIGTQTRKVWKLKKSS
jgi:hypothetical protein